MLILIKLPCFEYSDGQTRANHVDPNQTPQNAASGSTLFATRPAIVHTFTCSKIDLFKKSIKVLNI